MLRIAKLAAAVGFVAGGLTLAPLAASAMPALDTQPAQAAQAEGSSGVQQAYVVCGPFRCFHRGFYGYRRPFFGYGYGYRRFGYYHRPFFHRRFY